MQSVHKSNIDFNATCLQSLKLFVESDGRLRVSSDAPARENLGDNEAALHNMWKRLEKFEGHFWVFIIALRSGFCPVDSLSVCFYFLLG